MRRAGVLVHDDLTSEIAPCLELDAVTLPLTQIGAVAALHIERVDVDDLDNYLQLELTSDVPWELYMGSKDENLRRDEDDLDTRRVAAQGVLTETERNRWRQTLNIVDDRKLDATLKHTTALAVSEVRSPMRRHMKSRFPHLRVRRLKGVLYTDTYFASTPSRDG